MRTKTTYNRFRYLRQLLNSYYKTRNNNYDWNVYIVDDGSTDGTLEYLKGLNRDIKIIELNRCGVHEATNQLFDKALENIVNNI